MPTDKPSFPEAAMPLLLQRLAITAFMAVWIVDKFVNPGHASGVFAKFYGLAIGSAIRWSSGSSRS